MNPLCAHGNERKNDLFSETNENVVGSLWTGGLPLCAFSFFPEFYRYGQATPGRAGTERLGTASSTTGRILTNFLLLAHFHIRRVVFLAGAGCRTASKSARGPTFWTHTQLTAHLPQTKHPVCVSSHFRVYVRNTNQCHSDVTPSFEYSQREMDRDSLF